MRKHVLLLLVLLMGNRLLVLFLPAVTTASMRGTNIERDILRLWCPMLYEATCVVGEDDSIKAKELEAEAIDGDYTNLAVLENEQMAALLEENAIGISANDVEQADETEPTVPVVTTQAGDKVVEINREKLNDFDYLCQKFYTVDSSTTITSNELNATELLAKDLHITESQNGEPTILIYHTHSQEGYLDSSEGDATSSVVAVGEYLTKLLTEQYGFTVLHHTGEYDVGDRDHAYSNAAPCIEQLLAQNPSIQVVIDLHRDSVGEQTHLVTDINGKPTAKIMFFNGLCRTNARGELEYLKNPYLMDNLAFSLQMQLAAAEYYPDFTRHIYLKGYRYNMHFCPKTLLVEVGAQNNSLEEALNAMEPLSDLLSKVLKE